METQVNGAEPISGAVVLDCPHCGGPLSSDALGHRCTGIACGFTVRRDDLLAELVLELIDARKILKQWTAFALPKLSLCARGACDGEADPQLERLRDLAIAVASRPEPRNE